jgi:hypothetical protein
VTNSALRRWQLEPQVGTAEAAERPLLKSLQAGTALVAGSVSKELEEPELPEIEKRQVTRRAVPSEDALFHAICATEGCPDVEAIKPQWATRKM